LTLKLKEEGLIWPEQQSVAGVAIGMLGSAIGKGDGDAATLLKKRRKAFDEQYLKVLVQGF
jgi:hypothetical protein